MAGPTRHQGVARLTLHGFNSRQVCLTCLGHVPPPFQRGVRVALDVLAVRARDSGALFLPDRLATHLVQSL